MARYHVAVSARFDGPVVVSAFEPFGERQVNRSQQLLESLVRAAPAVVPVVFPVAFAALEAGVAAVAARRPRRWLLLGESGLATGLTLERRAYNRIDARIPDNAGDQPRDVPVDPRLPAVQSSRAPLGEWAAALQAAGVPAVRSLDAGRFACNAVYARALASVGGSRALFVHVPTDEAHASDAVLVRGLQLLLRRWTAR
jgi:pyroglutamyl-peptidase